MFTPIGHSVHRGSTCAGAPQAGTHPLRDHIHRPGRYTPPGPGAPTRQVHPLGPGTPCRAGTPPGIRYTPWAGTPPRTRYTPRDQVPPQEQCILGDTANKRAVRILLECIFVD